jgi:hypothetical protein
MIKDRAGNVPDLVAYCTALNAIPAAERVTLFPIEEPTCNQYGDQLLSVVDGRIHYPETLKNYGLALAWIAHHLTKAHGQLFWSPASQHLIIEILLEIAPASASVDDLLRKDRWTTQLTERRGRLTEPYESWVDEDELGHEVCGEDSYRMPVVDYVVDRPAFHGLRRFDPDAEIRMAVDYALAALERSALV